MCISLIKMSICSVFFLFYSWPVIIPLLSSNKEKPKIYIYLCAFVLDLSLIYWAILIDMFQKMIPLAQDYAVIKRKRIRFCYFALIFGTPLSVSCMVLASKLLSLYLGDFSKFMSETSYITSLCIITSMILWLVIVLSVFTIQKECYNNLAGEICACFLVWGIAVTFLMILYVYSMKVYENNQGCELVQSYWNTVFGNLFSFSVLGLAFGLCYVADNHHSYGYEDLSFLPPLTKGMKVIGAVYLIGFFPFNLYWLIDGLGYLADGKIQNCNENLTAVMMNIMLYTASIAIGILGLFMGLLSCFVLGVKYVSRLFCPVWYHNVWNGIVGNGYENSSSALEQPLMLELIAEGFDPSKHPTEFTKEEMCSICLDAFEAKQTVVYWNRCKHLFHHRCLDYWVKKNASCPNCKRPYH